MFFPVQFNGTRLRTCLRLIAFPVEDPLPTLPLSPWNSNRDVPRTSPHHDWVQPIETPFQKGRNPGSSHSSKGETRSVSEEKNRGGSSNRHRTSVFGATCFASKRKADRRRRDRKRSWRRSRVLGARCVPGRKETRGSTAGRSKEATRTCFVRAVRALVRIRSKKVETLHQEETQVCSSGCSVVKTIPVRTGNPYTGERHPCSVQVSCRTPRR